ncbi:AAA family ATPase [Thalassorhabdomicrobium marinisediminis]|uniref:ATPase AAA-type core domain-containing protein n=1 Tax=Thalassorhabdomicrobium marinisediminis TaxID=2170577 RepID=A0A2T7FT30_9RHOB|nr:AAA family ATPase [Thalassorhabdomicrobium marinisediminis]PVA05331.1 hypothetical protein DC363_16085 [Thalassorhabdomicrobium marinisediminis]
MGDYLKAMATVVAEAMTRVPSAIFFDELDSFGTRTRDPGSKLSRYMTAVINDLLQQLTRLNAAEGVIVIAATNHLDQTPRFPLTTPSSPVCSADPAQISPTSLGTQRPGRAARGCP